MTSVTLLRSGVLVLLLMVPPGAMSGQTAIGRPAVPLEAKSAILDAFRSYQLVALGDAHGNQQGEAFQLALIRDPRFAATVNDIIVEGGNSRYQELVDRFIRGEDVSHEALRRVWLDTTQQQVASLETPELFNTIRALNRSLSPDRRLRVLVGEPPIDWERLRTADDWRAWDTAPTSDRDRFGVDLIRREVLAKNRRGLALYGAGHFFRKNINHSLVSLLEDVNAIKVFTIWTNAAADLASMQPDVTTWAVPSLARVQDTMLGNAAFADYFGPSGKDIPPQWRARMQDQFDAVLYLGPLSAITFARPRPWPCSEPALAERIRRLTLQRPALAERVKQECVA